MIFRSKVSFAVEKLSFVRGIKELSAIVSLCRLHRQVDGLLQFPLWISLKLTSRKKNYT